MESLVNYVLVEFFLWLVVGFAGWKLVESVRDSKIGTAIMALAFGGVAIYCLKNPIQALEWIGNIIGGRLFGG